jgi:hypothetical protein
MRHWGLPIASNPGILLRPRGSAVRPRSGRSCRDPGAARRGEFGRDANGTAQHGHPHLESDFKIDMVTLHLSLAGDISSDERDGKENSDLGVEIRMPGTPTG